MEKKILLLLQIISSNGNIRKLIHAGSSFKEIPEITDMAISLGYIIYEDEKISLSKLGYEFLIKNKFKLRSFNEYPWIEKDKKSQIPKISINDIFLPSKDGMSF